MTEKPKRKNSDRRRNYLWLWLLGVLLICSLVSVYGFQQLFQPVELVDACEVYITDELQLRIESFSNSMVGYKHYYQILNEDDESWITFHSYDTTDDGDGYYADCSDYHVYSPDKIYFLPSLSGHYLMITTDGGETWHEWRPDMVEFPEGLRCTKIDEISFQDETRGEMQLRCYSDNNGVYVVSSPVILHSNDGGITWNLAND